MPSVVTGQWPGRVTSHGQQAAVATITLEISRRGAREYGSDRVRRDAERQASQEEGMRFIKASCFNLDHEKELESNINLLVKKIKQNKTLLGNKVLEGMVQCITLAGIPTTGTWCEAQSRT